MSSEEAITAKIEACLQQHRWSAARRWIERALKDAPADHWLHTMLGLTFYEQKDYERALPPTEAALRLQPECPLVLFHYAGTLFMLGRHEEALAVWKRLLAKDVAAVADDECGEGMDWALQLLNDCHFRMARCYQFLGDNEAARLSYLKYLHNRSHGVGSIYHSDKAEKGLAAVSE
jgi:tetratricopeptide (TPR) repeat protein